MGIKRNGALWGGILFSLAFTCLIWLAAGRLAAVEHLPDLGASWYYWQLPVPTFWSRASAWGLYLAHQATLWWLIWRAQRQKLRYTETLHPVNWLALGANALFILLHFLQTHLFYDGLAQDVSIWSSQVSVSILLILVLLMENPRRGLLFGRKAPIKAEAVRMVRQYHGYFFAWAIIYTFWYHPMEGSMGHLIGFVYMFLLMLQGSLFFTRSHVNRWWTLAQEVLVVAHGALVAVQQGNGMWPMFAFGFGGIFVITQMHGLSWSKAVRATVLGLYLVLVTLTYSRVRGWGHLFEITYIPIIDYVGVFLFAGLIGGLAAAWRRRQNSENPAEISRAER
ncbi:MAG TPA: hypothetical protein VNT01_08640 [Symbiobacteriaceae bacterium]|nr:hypothetical protein [Symbiobacteriaceae bacterium]